MYETTIQLNAINDVKDFVNKVMLFNYDIDLVSGRYAIDASRSWAFSAGSVQADQAAGTHR